MGPKTTPLFPYFTEWLQEGASVLRTAQVLQILKQRQVGAVGPEMTAQGLR